MKIRVAILQRQVWHILQVTHDEEKGERILDVVDTFLLILIFLNGLAFILDTVHEIHVHFGFWLVTFEHFSIAVFTIEYILRVWSCVVDPAYAHPVRGRLRYMMTPIALIDLFATLPFYLPYFGLDLGFVRMLRLMRLFRVAKLVRYLEGLQLLTQVLRSKREDLVLTSTVLLLLLTLSSSLMYYAEHNIQPDKFTDIPATMWWAVATLTTVGYGDLYPVSAPGKLLGSIVAILGIGLFALPTAILGSGYIEAMESRKERDKAKTEHFCPHCGKPLD